MQRSLSLMRIKKDRKEVRKMECMQCGHENERDARFCRNCGSQMGVPKGVTPSKDQVEFVPTKRRAQEDFLCFGEEEFSSSGGYVLGVVFIVIGLIIAAAIFLPDVISNLAGGFGETVGNLGSDFGEFMGNWGERFGNTLGNFFEGIFTENWWWELLKILIVGMFIIGGALIIFFNYRKR